MRLWNIAALVLAVLWMAAVFYVSSKPDPFAILPWISGSAVEETAKGSPLTAIAVHFSEYFVLALLLRWAVAPRRGALWADAAALSLALAFAISDELHQRFTPGRDSSMTDVGIDLAGMAAALLCWRLAGALRSARPSDTARLPENPLRVPRA